MMATIQKWGNSQAVRFPKALLAEANIQLGDDVRIFIQGVLPIFPLH
jgi:antitoxin component of MazEF toxin-antitoxin module